MTHTHLIKKNQVLSRGKTLGTPYEPQEKRKNSGIPRKKMGRHAGIPYDHQAGGRRIRGFGTSSLTILRASCLALIRHPATRERRYAEGLVLDLRKFLGI